MKLIFPGGFGDLCHAIFSVREREIEESIDFVCLFLLCVGDVKFVSFRVFGL